MQQDIVTIEPTLVNYNQDKAIIDSMIATAKAFPRDIQRAVSNSIAIVTMDTETAQSCTFSVPRGGKPITGPSVHLARILFQQWGNLRAETKVVDITDKHVISQAIAFDIETNIALKVEVRRSIMTKTGRMSDDMITVTGNAGNAIALRNAIFSITPKSVIDKVYKAATGLLTGDISDETKLIVKRKTVIEKLKETYSVTEEEILSAVGKSKVEYIKADELVILIGIGTAIKDGDTTVDEAFRPNKNKRAKDVDKSNELERVENFIKKASDLNTLESIKDHLETPEQLELFETKKQELTK